MQTLSGSRTLMTVEQAMGQLSCSRFTVYKLVREGKLELVRFGKRGSRITERSLNSYVDELLSSPSPSIQPGRDDEDQG